ncbi:MAG TPA: aminopeptidase, partial [Cryomorphaceae bacterium]|nr:aminopeptidase [Cryomorphaceae bacterium]
YKVAITVPEDHLVAATGVLQNEVSVLSSTQRKRLSEARQNFDNPVLITTEAEARVTESADAKAQATGRKTWIFKADNVRDFAFATSRKFIWDAMAVKVGGKVILAE